VQIGRERSRLIERVTADSGPEIIPEDFGVRLGIPQQFEAFALRIVLDARQANQRRISRFWRRNCLFDQPVPVTCPNESARKGEGNRHAVTVAKGP